MTKPESRNPEDIFPASYQPGSACQHGRQKELDGRCQGCDCGIPSHESSCLFVASMFRTDYPAAADRILELVQENRRRRLASSEKAITDAERNGLIEACANIAGLQAAHHDDLKGAHYRHSPEVFKPEAFGVDMEVVKWSRDAALRIRAMKVLDDPER